MKFCSYVSRFGLVALCMAMMNQIASSQAVIVGTQSFTNISAVMNPTQSGHGPHAFKIATLPANNVGDDDHLHIVANVNASWAASANASVDALFGNRGGFTYVYSARGVWASSSAKLAAYMNSDTSVDIYLMFADQYTTGSYQVLETTEDTIYSSPTDLGAATPPGTLVFDSSSPNYPPATFQSFNGHFGVGTSSPISSVHVAGSGDQVITLQSTSAGSPGLSFNNTVGGYTNQLDGGTASLYWWNGSKRTMFLSQAGILTLTGGLTFADGTSQSTAWTGVLCGGDYAESMNVSGDRKHYEPGDVLVLTSATDGDVEKSAEAYSSMVAGIFATKPGLVGRRQTTPKSNDEVPLAMVGVVPTKVSAENGSIRRGDLLVSSSLPGYAMKGTDRSRMLGAIIGKAMGNLDAGTGTIEVLVTLQ